MADMGMGWLPKYCGISAQQAVVQHTETIANAYIHFMVLLLIRRSVWRWGHASATPAHADPVKHARRLTGSKLGRRFSTAFLRFAGMGCRSRPLLHAARR